MLQKTKIMNDIKARFREFFSKNHYTRIDPNHILDLYIGLNGNGQCTLEYRGHFTKKILKESSSIDIAQGSEENYNFLLLSLKDPEMFDTFCALCADIVESTRICDNNDSGYNVIIDRLYSWKKLFSSKKERLQESTIMGIIGELLFLHSYLFPTYGQHEALAAWSGQELTHKDFSMDHVWYEVKAIHTGKQQVRISSLDQLQSNNDGELIIVSLERMSEAYDGIFLSKIATRILNEITYDFDKDMFLNQLYHQGYQFSSDDDRYVYDCTSINRYKVSYNFPKLIRNEINEAIVQAQYDIDINEILKYQIQDQ